MFKALSYYIVFNAR